MSPNNDLNFEAAAAENSERTGCRPKPSCCHPHKEDCVSADCACFLQMRNILQQLITLCPNASATVTLLDGTVHTGRLNSLYPSVNPGLLLLANSSDIVQEAIPICQIAAVSITCMTCQALEYLPAPEHVDFCCGFECQSALRCYLPIGTTNVILLRNGVSLASGTISANEFGLIAVATETASCPCTTTTFVSLCAISSVTRD